MENQVKNDIPFIPNVTIKTHLDFKLDGWPASVTLITFCLSSVMIYGITVWGQNQRQKFVS